LLNIYETSYRRYGESHCPRGNEANEVYLIDQLKHRQKDISSLLAGLKKVDGLDDGGVVDQMLLKVRLLTKQCHQLVACVQD
jgi:hypothetical protein